MNLHTNRRNFLGAAAAVAGAGYWVSGTPAEEKTTSPLEKIRFGCIGIGGKGDSDTADAARHGEVIAICDVDDNRLQQAGTKKYPKAEKFHDFRKLLDKVGKSIDAVTVSTPDHTHAVASALAMLLGKHCFTQKPLTRTIWEARRLGEIAREKKVATQMGNQGTAGGGLREAAAFIRGGGLGTVTEVHVWTNRPIWPQGIERAKPEEPPANLKWDLWLGPSPERPYAKGYHPFGWRGWWDFGSGALGDMACHTFNMPFMALDLRDPTEVEAESSGHNKDSFPKWSQIRYAFPAKGDRPALKVMWYDGGKKPDKGLFGQNDVKLAGSGCLVIGEKGKLYSSGDNGDSYRLIGVDKQKVDYPKSPGHFREFADAIRGKKPAMSNFPDYAGPLTETILLGNLAVFSGRKVEWDAKEMKVKNFQDETVNNLVKPVYRAGWTF